MQKLEFNSERLTTKELLYFNLMRSQYGVLYCKGKPGVAKSAIARAIASKLKWRYEGEKNWQQGINFIDIRLSMCDETDVGLFPIVSEVDNSGNFTKEGEGTVKVLDHVVPRWAIKANSFPTLVVFEELNRAPLSVRNAALQLLLEREIGAEFKFTDRVFMMATGNLGEEDGTDVEEFDAALNNRLIHVKHDLTTKEWLDGFATLNSNLEPITKEMIKEHAELTKKIKAGELDAKEVKLPNIRQNIIPAITSYLRVKEGELYKSPTEKDNGLAEKYATPRSWTMFSKMLEEVLGEKDVNDYAKVRALAGSTGEFFIGDALSKFQRYLDDAMKFTLKDVFSRFDQIEHELRAADRSKIDELTMDLKDTNLWQYKNKRKEIDNLIKFFGLLDSDQLMSTITYILDGTSEDKLEDEPIFSILSSAENLLDEIEEKTG